MATDSLDANFSPDITASVFLYGGTCETLDNLRYKKYLQKVAIQKQAVQP